METTNKKLAERITKGEAVVFNETSVKCIGTPSVRVAWASDKYNAELIAEAFNVTNETRLSPRELKEQRDELIDALQKIVEWKFPPTGQFWDNEKRQPMSFGSAYGSNGERDYMRNIAKAAIKKVTK